MTESLEQHYRRLLGLQEPWVVEAVNLALAAQRVEIRLRAEVDTRGLKCPECGKWSALYDHAPERRWRHLDTMQFETVLVARIPRVNCPEHGVKTIEVPWAAKNSRFTLMFEAFAIRVLQACETVSWRRALAAGLAQCTPNHGASRRTRPKASQDGDGALGRY
jgi:transposase